LSGFYSAVITNINKSTKKLSDCYKEEYKNRAVAKIQQTFRFNRNHEIFSCYYFASALCS